MSYKAANEIESIVADSKQILVIQADNPDADSVASALALEQILHKLGKEPILYCSVDIPSYLRYMDGWDRISNELPSKFDSSIIVDTSSLTLLEKINSEGKKGWIAAKPCIVLDHHANTGEAIDFAEVTINDTKSSSTGEVIFNLARELKWPLDPISGAHIMTAILGDTQGLTNQLTTAQTYGVMAKLVELGVDRPKLEEQRRELSKMPETIFKYKGRLIERTELHASGRIAFVQIPHHEIVSYSPLYNPAPLVQGDMLQTDKVEISIVLKVYDNGRITAAIRANSPAPIAGKLAEHFGGGGHDYASGFKVLDGRKPEEVKSSCLQYAEYLLDQLKSEI
jgi:phosphoesterase RecJ-like protein